MFKIIDFLDNGVVKVVGDNGVPFNANLVIDGGLLRLGGAFDEPKPQSGRTDHEIDIAAGRA